MSVTTIRHQGHTPKIDAGVRRVTTRVLTADRVYTGARGGLIADGAVVLDGERIAWVGQRAELPQQYQNWTTTGYGDATILPGLIETHAHLRGIASVHGPDVPDPDRHTPSWLSLASIQVARQLASIGVTTVQSLGAHHYSDVVAREAIAQGLVEGPRIVASGAPITTRGGHSWRSGAEVDSLTQIREQVRDHHKAGVDVIKVMATGGFGTYGSAPWNSQFSTEEFRVLIDDAHRLGKHVAAHAHGTQGIRRVVEAGIDYIAHATFISEDGHTEFDPYLADQIAAHGIYVDPASPPSVPAVAGETITPRAYELYQHGVKVVVGHDIGAVLPPSAYVWGLTQLEDSGLPREEVLIAATSRAAAAVGLAGVTGLLATGYDADLIVAAGDPLSDLRALSHLHEIVIRGAAFAPDVVEPFDPESRRQRSTGPDAARSPLAPQAERLAKQQRAAAHPQD